MKFVPKAVTRTVAKQVLKTKKNSPTILFAAGIAGAVGSTVLACRATLKLEEVLDETQSTIEKAVNLQHKNYSDSDRKKDIGILYVRGAIGVVKLYAPAVILGGLSIAALTGSHRILGKRNAALLGAYTSMAAAFEEYQQRVREEVGEDRERELRYSVEQRDVAVDTEQGVVLQKQATSSSLAGASPYARVWGEGCTSWDRYDTNGNATFLKVQQQYANSLLHANGFIMLNDVYHMLGLPKTTAGAVVGWVRNNGDNYVSFGFGDWPTAIDYINGTECGVVLDFNVDGVVYDLIDKI